MCCPHLQLLLDVQGFDRQALCQKEMLLSDGIDWQKDSFDSATMIHVCA